MTVAECDAKRFGRYDRAVTVINENIVVARALHLRKVKDITGLSHIVDVDKLGVLLGVVACHDVKKRIRRIKRGKARNAQQNRLSVKGDILVHRRVEQSTRIDDHVDLTAFQKLKTAVGFTDSGNAVDLDTEPLNRLFGFGRRINRDTEVDHLLGDVHDFVKVVLVNADKSTEMTLRTASADRHACAGKTLIQRFVERFADSEHLTGRFHFGS